MSVKQMLLIALAILLVGIVSTSSGARPVAAPTIEQVLASGSNANGWGIQNIDEITLNGIRSANGNPATAVTLRQGVQINASNGAAAENAGDITLNAGYGNNGSTSGAAVNVQGGRAAGPGYVVIVTGDSAGHAGDCLRSDGAGHAVWGPCGP